MSVLKSTKWLAWHHYGNGLFSPITVVVCNHMGYCTQHKITLDYKNKNCSCKAKCSITYQLFIIVIIIRLLSRNNMATKADTLYPWVSTTH